MSSWKAIGASALVLAVAISTPLAVQAAPDDEQAATNVFRKENGQWKMIGHHTDLLPFLSK